MSRKQSSRHSPHHDTNHTQDAQCQRPVVPKHSRWQQLWDKLSLNGYQTREESNGEKPPSPPPKKTVYLKLLLKLLSKFPKRNKHYFDPKKLQKQILEDIGQQLQEERHKQGLSLELISAETRISMGLLEAIEKAKLEELPEAIYTRSFIKKFADFLGLDGKSLSESFPLDSKPKSQSSSRFRFLFPVLQFRPIHLYFLYIIIVVISVQSISNTLKRAATEGAIEELPVPVVVSPPPPPIQKPVIVKVRSTGKSTLKVTVDGKMTFEGTLSKETQKTWEADQNITLEASDAGLILVTFNNQNAKRLGKLGENKKVTYSIPDISNNVREQGTGNGEEETVNQSE
ncbi:helix-turn-helix domain-containing protein [Cyanothece sp. BG0011]|uniref:helix-turn-helix domain-containing protein n=1 Tax=Cyanothece sp. BG0011 TaxID=2082950 RepID=UPI000D1FCCF6|nr:helix-turn-helix domain-containing protein [Cyanothece sp. BG0011]